MSPRIPSEIERTGLGATFVAMLQAKPPVVEITDEQLPQGWRYSCWDDVTPGLAIDLFRNKFGRMPPVAYLITTLAIGKSGKWTRRAWIPHSPVPGEVQGELFTTARESK